jgi:hypothetical protein
MVQSSLSPSLASRLRRRGKGKQAKRASAGSEQSGIFIIKIFPAVCSFTFAGTSSFVSYTPMTELDYGTLLCSATNKIGKQKHPCIFHIIAAGRSAFRFPSFCVCGAPSEGSKSFPRALVTLRRALGLNIINDASARRNI